MSDLALFGVFMVSVGSFVLGYVVGAAIRFGMRE